MTDSRLARQRSQTTWFAARPRARPGIEPVICQRCGCCYVVTEAEIDNGEWSRRCPHCLDTPGGMEGNHDANSAIQE